MLRKSIRQARNEALRREMHRDPSIIVIGEDVAGGAGSERCARRLAILAAAMAQKPA